MKTKAELLLKRAKTIDEEAVEIKKIYKKKNKEALKIIKKAQAICDHHYSDGTSAWEHRFAYGICKICGYDDK